MLESVKDLKMNSPRKTIFMTQAQKDAWLTRLRDPASIQGFRALKDKTNQGAYCCLGHLQMALDGKVEIDPKSGYARGLPTFKWLEHHGITFHGTSQADPKSADAYLPSLKVTASRANDTEAKSLIEIADALEDAIQVIDGPKEIATDETRPLTKGSDPASEMTKRERFAESMLQGLLANPERYKYISRLVLGDGRFEKGISQEDASTKNADKAVYLADALIEALNKKETDDE